ncbi:MAG: hypothetical protein KGJ23_16520 [Euryarchaeota archaeon]|nr:hypothetical protein [Nitrososphaerota archaeon]MDE1838202.1 hypothetical protein [Euryarchaeota archaeon]MDE2046631.1 hypothetical protein [Thermoplasmata archaeon]
MRETRERTPGAIIAYQLGEISPNRKARFTERVLGADRKVEGRTYRRRGFLDEVPHWKVNRGVLLVRAEDRTRVVRALREWTRDVEWWEVALTHQQVRRLQRTPSG